MIKRDVLPKDDNEIYSIGVKLQPFYNKEHDEWLWIATDFFDDTFHNGSIVDVQAYGKTYEELFKEMEYDEESEEQNGD